MRLTETAYEPPAIDGYTFWSVFSSDAKTQQAILDDPAGEAYARATTAGDFDISLDDVKAVLHQHPHYNRPVWHAYVRDIHRAKVIYKLEELDLMLRAMQRAFRDDGF